MPLLCPLTLAVCRSFEMMKQLECLHIKLACCVYWEPVLLTVDCLSEHSTDCLAFLTGTLAALTHCLSCFACGWHTTQVTSYSPCSLEDLSCYVGRHLSKALLMRQCLWLFIFVPCTCKDLLSEEALADRRDVQSIPCYSVEPFILLALRADAFE